MRIRICPAFSKWLDGLCGTRRGRYLRFPPTASSIAVSPQLHLLDAARLALELLCARREDSREAHIPRLRQAKAAAWVVSSFYLNDQIQIDNLMHNNSLDTNPVDPLVDLPIYELTLPPFQSSVKRTSSWRPGVILRVRVEVTMWAGLTRERGRAERELAATQSMVLPMAPLNVEDLLERVRKRRSRPSRRVLDAGVVLDAILTCFRSPPPPPGSALAGWWWFKRKSWVGLCVRRNGISRVQLMLNSNLERLNTSKYRTCVTLNPMIYVPACLATLTSRYRQMHSVSGLQKPELSSSGPSSATYDQILLLKTGLDGSQFESSSQSGVCTALLVLRVSDENYACCNIHDSLTLRRIAVGKCDGRGRTGAGAARPARGCAVRVFETNMGKGSSMFITNVQLAVRGQARAIVKFYETVGAEEASDWRRSEPDGAWPSAAAKRYPPLKAETLGTRGNENFPQKETLNHLFF
ncbi:hypothetical protein C8R46DRAFT_1047275 [Mycena filopes]|nr:hypothetical protein C8R46DRAFT_1047275 [Mycena filopes]